MQTDKTTLCILAHQAAQPSIYDFLPKWQSTGFHLICALPEGDTIQGFDDCIHAGESAHSGSKSFRRFIQTAKALRDRNMETNIIAEYDTVPLQPKPLPIFDATVTCGAIMAYHHNKEDGPQQACTLSPWAMDHATLCRLVDALEDAFNEDSDGIQFCGLLDRWLAWAMTSRGITYFYSDEILPWTKYAGIHQIIRDSGYNWIHGWKRKAQFGSLWT